MTEKRMRWRSIRFQEWDLRFIRASTVASSLEMCCSRFSKSSPCNLKIPFQIREMSPLLFFVTTAASFFAVSLSAAPSSVAIRPDHSSVNRVTVSVVIVCFQNEMRSPGAGIGVDHMTYQKLARSDRWNAKAEKKKRETADTRIASSSFVFRLTSGDAASSSGDQRRSDA